jgi:hypothetical protein
VAKRCENCGYLHSGTDKDLCESCGAALQAPLDSLVRLSHVFARRRDRINSDEEERQRQGYDVWSSVRFADRGGKPSVRVAEVVYNAARPSSAPGIQRRRRAWVLGQG